MSLRYSDTFSGFPQILRSWNRDLRTTHNTFQSFSMHSRTPFFPTTSLKTALYELKALRTLFQ